MATTPVEGIAHFDGHQHGQSHRRGVSRLEDLTVNSLKDGVVLSAPHEVPLSAQETAGEYMAEQQERQERGGRVDWLGGRRWTGLLLNIAQFRATTELPTVTQLLLGLGFRGRAGQWL